MLPIPLAGGTLYIIGIVFKNLTTREVNVKKVILLFSILALAACSSTPKETPTEPTVADTTAKTDTTSAPTTVQADMGGSSMNTGSAVTMDGSGQFPPIEGTERASTTCTAGSDTRVITTIDRKEGGCGNVYTKFGNKMTIALANNDMTYCDKVHDNVKSNLETGGMNCGGATAAAPAPETEAKPETKTQ